MYDVRKQASNAAEAYKMHQANITVKFAQPLDLQRAHAERAAQAPRDWGFAGDLSHLEDVLDRALAAIGGPQD